MQNNFNISSLLKLASGKTPEEFLNSLPKEQSDKVKEVLNNKELTEKLINSKEAKELLKRMKK